MAMATLAASASSTAALSQRLATPSPANFSKYSVFRLPALSFSRIRLVSPSTCQHRRSFVAAKAAETETTKEVEEEKDTDESESENESSDDENDGASSDQSTISVELLLKKYKEAVSNSDKTALADIESKLQSLEKERDSYSKQASTLIEEVALVKERLLRLNADFDNFRKRSERERLAVSANVKADVVNSLLPMVDNFERAKTQLKIETEGEQRIDGSYQGIYKQFVEIMKGLGVSAVETIGKEFDPNIHEAIMREDSSEYAEGLVIEEFRRGFMLGEKLLRPAMVKVSAGSPTAPAAEESFDSEEVSEESERTEE